MLEVSGISKSFPGVKALQDISVQFKDGEIHALLGENGAGKSTLMKIICGIYKADTGKVVLDGKELKLHGYGDAVKQHISMVHQEIQLIPEGSIAENIVNDKISQFTKFGFVNWKAINQFALKYMKEVGLDFPPEKKVRFLSAAHKQLIQIAKALSADARVLLLDEPTSSLTRHEANTLFELVRKLKDKGMIIIFVSHKLEEVQVIADRVTVFRDGCLVGTDNIGNMENSKIIKMMIGRDFVYRYRGRLDAYDGEVALEARNITSRIHGFKDMSFKVHKGEILGFYGLVGSGRTELVRTMLNIDKCDGGEVLLWGKPVKIDSFKTALHKYKIGYVTENRKEEGLFLEHTVAMNVCVNSWNKSYYRRIPFINLKKEKENADVFAKRLEIKTPSLNTLAGKLSGGNQQKISIAKWLAADCDILIIDEPTVGVDIGAKEYIHELIWNLAAKEGKTVILISSDMNEMISLARRILIFRDRQITGELSGEEFFAKTGEEISTEIGKSFV
ncbi:sugar ABC transporter ATP-binding protein [Lacrimispora sp. NSJ-141]|uniref:Sugar ABC transporter ATP-binding protein n=1 Tax=Lientehia hominis TaxID=2897778 RepID=A0AAP2RH75_9FIRM|nr:sugar ABC transporter ATP-binding protein [Lientehia hominis]MCD2491911.1 sugar ABC transporter ATP-binding protein [Lientehia hominis]